MAVNSVYKVYSRSHLSRNLGFLCETLVFLAEKVISVIYTLSALVRTAGNGSSAPIISYQRHLHTLRKLQLSAICYQRHENVISAG